jgi:hypothetical protein
MKSRLRFELFIILFPLFSYGQADWEVIKLDRVSFSFPSEHTKTDTLGQHIDFAWTPVGRVQAAKIPQPHAQFKNESELLGFLQSFQDITIEKSYGDLVSDSTLKIEEHAARLFTYSTSYNDTSEIHENMIVYISPTIYSFSYSCYEDEKGLAMKEKHAFFDGITIYGPDKNVLAGEFAGLILRYVMIAGALIAILLWFFKKYRAVSIIKTVFAWTFLAYGSILTLFFLGNLAFDNHLPHFIFFGVTFLAVGFFLRWMKVPTRIN